jgi:hypothetical protein
MSRPPRFAVEIRTSNNAADGGKRSNSLKLTLPVIILAGVVVLVIIASGDFENVVMLLKNISLLR